MHHCLNRESFASMTLLSQHTLMFRRPAGASGDLVLPHPTQGNLALRYACSAQTLPRKNELSFFLDICNQDTCIYSKSYNVHLSRYGYYSFFSFFFLSVKRIHKTVKLVLLLVKGRAIADKPRS